MKLWISFGVSCGGNGEVTGVFRCGREMRFEFQVSAKPVAISAVETVEQIRIGLARNLKLET